MHNQANATRKSISGPSEFTGIGFTVTFTFTFIVGLT